MATRPRLKTNRPRLSVCMIVRNEAAVLQRCLDSLDNVFDELCVVDTGSTDDTPAIALRLGAKVESHTDCNGPDGRIEDFARARNHALAMSTGEWILQIDADEVLLQGHAHIRRHMAQGQQDEVGIRMRSRGAEWISGRLFRRTQGLHYRSRIHEYLVHEGRFAIDPRITIENRESKLGKESASERNMRLCLLAIQDEPGEARNYHYLGNEYRELQRLDEAIASYRQALALDTFQVGRFHTAYYLAVCHLLKADWDEALDAAFAALRIDPRYAEGPCLLGDIYYSMGQPAFARQWYRAALVHRRPPADAVLATQAWAYGEHPREQLRKLGAISAGRVSAFSP